MKTKENDRRSAIFLDRDGTLIEDSGYIHDPSQVVFFEDTIPALRCLSEYFLLFIVTNQTGIAKGIISLQDVKRVNNHILSILAMEGIQVVEVYICPHAREDNCLCIKPKPFFLRKSEKDHGIDLKSSFVIGDHPHDVEFAENAGAKGIFLLSGHGSKHLHEIDQNAVVVARGIKEASEIILEAVKNRSGTI
ncbi:MAG: HAD family hydrolase [Caldiserica bacterium]|nr:HAD family hydrolase [Caldisericota bacterium]